MDFREESGKYAQIVGKDYNILPSFIMGVAWLESNGGKSGLAKQANNLFGIKGSYKGKSITMKTTEYDNGQPYKIDAKFRKYPSYKESFIDFCDLIENGVSWNRDIYAPAVIGKTNIIDVVTAFAKTPYMTDPNYRSKLLGVINGYKLTEYDNNDKSESNVEVEKEDLNTSTSVVDFMKSVDLDPSFEHRKQLAAMYKIGNYEGTAEQNLHLLTHLKEDYK